MNIFKKVPNIAQISPIYATIVVIIYSWSMFHFLWKLPGWLFFSPLRDIASIFAYMITVNFIESILVLLGVLFVTIVLPRRWFLDYFIPRAMLLVLLSLGYLVWFDLHLQAGEDFPLAMFRWSPIVLLIIPLIMILVDRVQLIRVFLEKLAENIVVFLYISIPVSIISILVVFVRNI